MARGMTDPAVWEVLPFPMAYSERLEKRCFGEVVEGLSRDLAEYEAQEPDATAVVIPHEARRRHDRPFQHEAIGIGRDRSPLHDVFRIVHGKSTLGPIQT